VRDDDLPINFEGTAIRADGSLLLGLRFPVAADGRPILFEPDSAMPEVEGFWVVDAVGRNGEMAGVHDLALAGDELHLVTGNVDNRDTQSVFFRTTPVADIPGRPTSAVRSRQASIRGSQRPNSSGSSRTSRRSRG
jgi:hypothetical protein